MKIILSTEAAYVRGGAYADTPQKLAEGMYADIKYTPDVDTYREGLLKFDISAFSSRLKSGVLSRHTPII